MVKLRRVDIITEVSIMSSHILIPMEGNFQSVHCIFAYLDKKHNSRIIFYPTYPDIDMSAFKKCEWKEFYSEAK